MINQDLRYFCFKILTFLTEGEIKARITARALHDDSQSANPDQYKLNWPTATNGGSIIIGQDVDYLTCYKENRMDTSRIVFETCHFPKYYFSARIKLESAKVHKKNSEHRTKQ